MHEGSSRAQTCTNSWHTSMAATKLDGDKRPANDGCVADFIETPPLKVLATCFLRSSSCAYYSSLACRDGGNHHRHCRPSRMTQRWPISRTAPTQNGRSLIFGRQPSDKADARGAHDSRRRLGWRRQELVTARGRSEPYLDARHFGRRDQLPLHSAGDGARRRTAGKGMSCTTRHGRLQTIRSKAKEWNIDPQRVGSTGGSARGLHFAVAGAAR